MRNMSSVVYAIGFSEENWIEVDLASVIVMGTVCIPTVTWNAPSLTSSE